MALGDGLNFPVSADVRDAIRNFLDLAEEADRLEARLDELDDEEVTPELVLEQERFRQQIADARRELNALSVTDPTLNIDATDVERAADDVADLRQQAERPIDIDVNVDQQGNAGRAADTVRRMGVEAEGIQRGIGPLRGFTDELGGASAAGGVAANALIDAGEAVEIFGGQLGFSERALSRISTTIAGVGVAVGAGLVAWKQYRDRQREVEEQTRETTSAILEQLGIVDGLQGRYDEAGNAYEIFADKLLDDDEDMERVAQAMAALGLNVDDLATTLRTVQTRDADGLRELVLAAGGSEEAADALAELVERGLDLSKVNWNAAESGLTGFDGASRDALDAIRILVGVAEDLQIDAAAAAALDQIAFSGEDAAAAIQALRDANPDASDLEILDLYVAKLDEVGDGAKSAQREWENAGRGIGGAIGEAAEQGGGMFDRLGEKGVQAAEDVAEAWAGALGQLTDQEQLLDLTEQQRRVVEAERKISLALTEDDRQKAIEDYQREVIRLAREVDDYAQSVDDIDEERVTNILTLLNEGSITEAQRLIDDLVGDRTITIDFEVNQPGPLRVRFDNDGSPTIIGSTDRSDAVFVDDGGTAGAKSVTNHYYQIIGQDPIQTRRDWEFRNGPEGAV